jgi:leucyl aminopeptidase
MNIVELTGLDQGLELDALVVGADATGQLSTLGQQIDQRLNGWLGDLIRGKRVRLSGPEPSKILMPPGTHVPPVVVLVNRGTDRGNSTGSAYYSAAAGVRCLVDEQRQTIGVDWSGDWPYARPHAAQIAAICGGWSACFGQDLYRREKKTFAPEVLGWHGATNEQRQTGLVWGRAVQRARQLVNEPANRVDPEAMAGLAIEWGQAAGLEVEVWDRPRLEAERCHALLAVARGSVREPRLVILRHATQGGEPPLGFVGKGVTFDSGGLSLKTAEGMTTMKCDMAGAATVLAVMLAAAELRITRPLIGVLGLVENMVDADCLRVGDVIDSRAGTTIEVLNTDAEGRLVLADCLDVALSAGCQELIDLATLTGACVVALGQDVTGAMSNHDELCQRVLAAADQQAEPIWRLPLMELYQEHIQSKIADIKNVGDGRWGGAVTAAKFLECFVQKRPWVHLDIAGPAFSDRGKPWRDAGGTGVMVRTLLELLGTNADHGPGTAQI